MKKKILQRILIGIPAGVSISHFISILISVIIGDGRYYPVTPGLIPIAGNEMNAVLIQAVGSALYGAVLGAASVIWDVESWSLLRMTLTHLAVIAAATFPAAWFMHWMPHTPAGGIGYMCIFLVIYAIIWICVYSATKRQIRKMNEQLRSTEPE